MDNATQTAAQPASQGQRGSVVGYRGDDGTTVTTHVRVRKADKGPGGVRRFIGFLGWVFTGFGLIPALLGRHEGRLKNQEITVYSAHRAFYLWALILVGFVGAWITHRWPNEGKTAVLFGWVYLWVMLYTFITMLFDVGTLKLLLWVGIFTLLWVTSKYIETLKSVSVLSSVFAYLRSLHPKLDPGFAAVVSWLLLIPWIGSLFLTFTNGRKRFSPNEISEWYIGEGCELTDRAGLKFRTKYRDVLESVLGFGSGDLLAYDNHQTVIKRYENVLFLSFLWHRIDEILHERSALVDNASDDPVEVQAVGPAGGSGGVVE